MSPSQEFYQRIAASADPELNRQVEAWTKSRFGDNRFLCMVETDAKRILFGYIRIGKYLGGGSLRLPVKMAGKIGLKPQQCEKILKQNNSQLEGEDSKQVFQSLNLEIDQVYGQIITGKSAGGLMKDGTFYLEYAFGRILTESTEPWRKIKNQDFEDKCVHAAIGFAEVFTKSLSGWKITPISRTNF